MKLSGLWIKPCESQVCCCFVIFHALSKQTSKISSLGWISTIYQYSWKITRTEIASHVRQITNELKWKEKTFARGGNQKKWNMNAITRFAFLTIASKRTWLHHESMTSWSWPPHQLCASFVKHCFGLYISHHLLFPYHHHHDWYQNKQKPAWFRLTRHFQAARSFNSSSLRNVLTAQQRDIGEEHCSLYYEKNPPLRWFEKHLGVCC